MADLLLEITRAVERAKEQQQDHLSDAQAAHIAEKSPYSLIPQKRKV